MLERIQQLLEVQQLAVSSTRSDQLRGMKLNNTDADGKLNYLKTGTSNIKLTLTANDGSTSGEITLNVEGRKRRSSPSEVTF